MKRLRQAKEEALTLSGRTETPDMAKVRRDLMAEDERIRDLAPRVSQAYRNARSADPEADAAWSEYLAGRMTPEQEARSPETVRIAIAADRQIAAKVEANRSASPEAIDADALAISRQIDVFDDINSPQAAAWMEAEIVSARADLDADDVDGSAFNAVSDDGTALNSLREILDEIDESDALVREFSKCRTGATE